MLSQRVKVAATRVRARGRSCTNVARIGALARRTALRRRRRRSECERASRRLALLENLESAQGGAARHGIAIVLVGCKGGSNAASGLAVAAATAVDWPADPRDARSRASFFIFDHSCVIDLGFFIAGTPWQVLTSLSISLEEETSRPGLRCLRTRATGDSALVMTSQYLLPTVRSAEWLWLGLTAVNLMLPSTVFLNSPSNSQPVFSAFSPGPSRKAIADLLLVCQTFHPAKLIAERLIDECLLLVLIADVAGLPSELVPCELPLMLDMPPVTPAPPAIVNRCPCVVIDTEPAVNYVA